MMVLCAAFCWGVEPDDPARPVQGRRIWSSTRTSSLELSALVGNIRAATPQLWRSAPGEAAGSGWSVLRPARLLPIAGPPNILGGTENRRTAYPPLRSRSPLRSVPAMPRLDVGGRVVLLPAPDRHARCWRSSASISPGTSGVSHPSPMPRRSPASSPAKGPSASRSTSRAWPSAAPSSPCRPSPRVQTWARRGSPRPRHRRRQRAPPLFIVVGLALVAVAAGARACRFR